MISLLGLGFLYLFCFACYKSVFYFLSAKLVYAERSDYSISVTVSLFSTFTATFISYFLIHIYFFPDNGYVVMSLFFITDILICLFFFSISFLKGVSVSFLSTIMCIISSLGIVSILSVMNNNGYSSIIVHLHPIINGLLQYLQSFNIELISLANISNNGLD